MSKLRGAILVLAHYTFVKIRSGNIFFLVDNGCLLYPTIVQ